VLARLGKCPVVIRVVIIFTQYTIQMVAVKGEPLLMEKTHNHFSLGVIQHLQEEVGKAKDLVF